MDLHEFDLQFDKLWQDKYTVFDPENDHWTVERTDRHEKQKCRDMLVEYARNLQTVGTSRRGKNKPQRIFDEMGVDPTDLELDAFSGGKEPNLQVRASQARPIAKGTDGRILYIERKTGDMKGEARIGRVAHSKSKATLYYGGLSFRSLAGHGYKSNYYCVETGEEYWISGPKRDGSDRLYGERLPIHIDADAQDEYWTAIRRDPGRKNRDVG